MKRKGDGRTVGTVRMTRLVWVIDVEGNLLRVVEVMHHMEADRLGLQYERNWRQAWIKETLVPGTLVLCDDGYITRVRRVAYGKADRYLHLDTGTYKLPDVQKNEHYQYTDPHSLRAVNITTRPVRAQYKWLEVDRHLLALRAVARYYIRNGFDLQAAWTRVFRRSLRKHKLLKKVLHSDMWRLALATEAKRYYDEAGITPTNVIQELFRRMQETDDNREALLLGHEIMRYHPDFEPNDMPMVSGRGSRGVLPLKAKAWLGDATIVKGIIDEPKDRPQPDAAAAAAATSEEADNAVQD